MTGPTLTCKMIPITSLQVGDKIAGGTVTGLRTSKSGLTIYVTHTRDHDGAESWFPQSTRTNIAKF